MNREYVLIRGGGDLATGVAWVLRRQGLPVVIIEQEAPTCVRRKVSFAEAVYSRQITVEGITGRLVQDFGEALELAAKGEVPLLVDAQGRTLTEHPPLIYIDATMSKGVCLPEIDRSGRLPELTIGLGPGFEAGVQVDVVIETYRNASLGKAIYGGTALRDTGIPSEVLGYGVERVLRAPVGGVFREVRQIGDIVEAGETVAYIEAEENVTYVAAEETVTSGVQVPVVSNLAGTLRGLLKSGLVVASGMKVGDVHPAVDPGVVTQMTDKARKIGEGVAKVIKTWQDGKVTSESQSNQCLPLH